MINVDEMFLLWLFGSQACEAIFRRLRSMSTTYSTIVYCTLLETVHRIKRIQFQEDVTSGKLNNDSGSFNYPRNSQDVKTKKHFDLPDIHEILKRIDKAKHDAFDKVKKLGLDVNISDCDKLSIQNLKNRDDIEKENSG